MHFLVWHLVTTNSSDPTGLAAFMWSHIYSLNIKLIHKCAFLHASTLSQVQVLVNLIGKFNTVSLLINNTSHLVLATVTATALTNKCSEKY